MKAAILTALFSILLLSSCNKDEQSKTFVLEDNFQIDQHFISTDNSLKFTVTEINDSRCPSDVVCIWQGEAVVKIAVESPISGILELSTFHNPSDTLGTYIFQIIEVTPYPVSTKVIELDDYNVKLKIEELQD